jgi:hypothetical protein
MKHYIFIIHFPVFMATGHQDIIAKELEYGKIQPSDLFNTISSMAGTMVRRGRFKKRA